VRSRKPNSQPADGSAAPDGLLQLALSSPERAEAVASELISTATSPSVLSVARQARGLVRRDRGELGPALADLRSAVRLAKQAGDDDREADVRGSLGPALIMAGQTRAGLNQLDLAINGATDPTTRAKVLMRRGYVLTFILGRHREALVDLERALPGIRRAGDRIWEARTLNLLGLTHLALGEVSAAAKAVGEAERMFVAEGQLTDAVYTLHNRGLIAFCRGDLPTTFALYEEAGERYAGLGPTPPVFAVDQAEALMSAGLVLDAAEVLREHLDRGSVQVVRRAELTLLLAVAELALGRADDSLSHASTALGLFRRQRREAWALRAELAVLQARERSGARGARLVETAVDVAARTQSAGLDETPTAWLLAGRLAMHSEASRAHELLARAAQVRHDSSNLVRAVGWLARALDCELREDTRGLLGACRQGLDAIDEHRMALGSSELRASSAIHGDELAGLALRRAASVSSRRMLWWSERWRANALAQAPVRPPADELVLEATAALRDNARRLAEARAENGPTAALEAARARLEQVIRRRQHRLAGSGGAAAAFDVERLIEAVGDHSFVELVRLDDRLEALVVGRGAVRRFHVGTVSDAVALLGSAQFALRQAARGRPAPMGTLPDRLQAALLGPAAAALGHGPVVVSPTAQLHAVPWTLLPALRDVPVSVVPSAALWLRTRIPSARAGARVFIAGPRLESGGSEVVALARSQPGSVVLREGSATVENCLRALDGAAVAHIAAHGHFRSDSPMFSTLEVDDGPLIVHDLERLGHTPRRMVLSACESGVIAPVGAGELLGFTVAMLSSGTVGLVSSVAVVNDDAAAELMLEVHRWLAEVDDLSEVMLRTRRAVRGIPMLETTAAAFLPLGA
jgi:tetratricopeptide (TPR) repeat protein